MNVSQDSFPRTRTLENCIIKTIGGAGLSESLDPYLDSMTDNETYNCEKHMTPPPSLHKIQFESFFNASKHRAEGKASPWLVQLTVC